MTFAWVIKTAFEALAPPEPHINDSTPFFTMILMDDSVLVEPDVGLRPAIAAETLETLTKTALGEEKPLTKRRTGEEGRYESSKIIWGLLYDSDLLTRSLPEPKLLKAAHLLNLPDFSYGCRTVDLSLIQDLRGESAILALGHAHPFGAARGPRTRCLALLTGRAGPSPKGTPRPHAKGPGLGFGKRSRCRDT